MASNTSDGDDKVVEFPKTAEERRAFRKAQQSTAAQKIVNAFIGAVDGPDTMFADANGVGFADMRVDGHRETWPIRSKAFRSAYIRYLKRQLEELVNAGSSMAGWLSVSIKKHRVNEAIDDFEMQAISSGLVREVHVRVAADGGDIYVDLGNAAWHAVRVTALGWVVVQDPPVRFRRSAGMLPLPFPERGIAIDRLRPFLNVTDSDFVLVVAYLLGALRPCGPYPMLALIGEQGTAKTSLVRMLRSLVDPSVVPTTALSLSGRDLYIAASNAHVLAFENVSKLSDTMSDYLCRLATGGGFRTRALYKDTDETMIRAARPIMVEGISNFVTRSDLMDRSIVLALEPLIDRKTEADLRAEFERLRPGLFGALLDCLVTGLRQLPGTRLANPPRMADFATWAVACGLDGFEVAYASNRQAAIDSVLEHDALARAVRALMAKRRTWQGTATELLDQLGDVSPNPKTLSDELRRLAPLLRSVGIDVRHHRTKVQRGIVISRLR